MPRCAVSGRILRGNVRFGAKDLREPFIRDGVNGKNQEGLGAHGTCHPGRKSMETALVELPLFAEDQDGTPVQAPGEDAHHLRGRMEISTLPSNGVSAVSASVSAQAPERFSLVFFHVSGHFSRLFPGPQLPVDIKMIPRQRLSYLKAPGTAQ